MTVANLDTSGGNMNFVGANTRIYVARANWDTSNSFLGTSCLNTLNPTKKLKGQVKFSINFQCNICLLFPIQLYYFQASLIWWDSAFK